ncbi:MAG: SAM-dependent methyltransferase [Verrucomicrobia bacterium]|nr:MAG: SAM-dependent methyltransferase [Verrucomicrobiota bacterium]
MTALPALQRFQVLLHTCLANATLVKLTLGKPRPGTPEPTLKNVFARPILLKAGPQIALVYRHATRDVAQNLPPAEAEATLLRLLENTFLDAHLFTITLTAQLEQSVAGPARLRQKNAPPAAEPTLASPALPRGHDRARTRLLAPDAPWLRALGVTNERGLPREGMAHKYRQIEKFAELLRGSLNEADLDREPRNAATGRPLQIADMGAGKGYLTFALAALLGERAKITGIERRADLVAICNRIAAETGFGTHLEFVTGDITSATPAAAPELDVLIALHACDTATDDALAAGHAAGAGLLVVSPCCQKELRPQLSSPEVLAGALRHGIFQERQAEFVTDALRAQLLECVGYRTKVFEFISTEHTAKNLMITAIRSSAASSPAASAERDQRIARTRAFAAFYGIHTHRLARHLGIALAAPT